MAEGTALSSPADTQAGNRVQGPTLPQRQEEFEGWKGESRAIRAGGATEYQTRATIRGADN